MMEFVKMVMSTACGLAVCFVLFYLEKKATYKVRVIIAVVTLICLLLVSYICDFANMKHQIESGYVTSSSGFSEALETGGDYDIKGYLYTLDDSPLYSVSENGDETINPNICFYRDEVKIKWSNMKLPDDIAYSTKITKEGGEFITVYYIPSCLEGVLHCTIENGEIVSGEFEPFSCEIVN